MAVLNVREVLSVTLGLPPAQLTALLAYSLLDRGLVFTACGPGKNAFQHG